MRSAGERTSPGPSSTRPTSSVRTCAGPRATPSIPGPTRSRAPVSAFRKQWHCFAASMWSSSSLGNRTQREMAPRGTLSDVSERGGAYERVRVICFRESSLLLVQHRWHDGSYFWMLPGGGIKDGETIEDTAV